MQSLRRAAALSRALGLGSRGTTGLWLTLGLLGTLGRLGRSRRERILRRTLRRGDTLLVRVADPGAEPPDGRRIR